MSVRIVPASGLEKIFLDTPPAGTYEGGSLLSNENYSFQFAFTAYRTAANSRGWEWADFAVESDIADNLELYVVKNVPVLLATRPEYDQGYLRTDPGMYPDPLMPLKKGEKVKLLTKLWQSVWVRVKGDVAPGEHTVRLTLSGDHSGTASAEVRLNVLSAKLPEQELIYTNWFHCDCIADLHHKEIFSDEYWTIMEKYMKLAAENGVSMILVPAFTPPLDTNVGAERMTAQLIDVRKDGEKYTFGFELFDRYIASAKKAGFKWFEHSHLFTQWGAEHAPKVMATVDGEYKRIFGWETEAAGPEYSDFLHQYLDALVPHLKELGIDDKFYYHISDEPHKEHLENYRRAKAVVYDRLKEYHFFDALSNVDFYKEGLTTTPVASTPSIRDFVGVADDLWAYYFGSHCFNGLSNRLISMTSRRNRVIGMQMYKNNIKGFLQWGFNFYYTTRCQEIFDPMTSPDALAEFPAGTCYQVYPVGDEAVPALRLFVFHDAIQDIRALKLLESAIGHDAVVALIESVDGKIDWNTCPSSDEQFIAVREAVNAEIAKHFC